MRNTFHVAFVPHLGAKRKYCFSVPEPSARAKWGAALNRQVWLSSVKKQQQATGPASKTPQGRVQRAAEAVALQVLRDALLSPEDKDKGEDSGGTASPHNHGQASPHSKLSSSVSRVLRQGSVSVAYPKATAEEADLGPLQPTRGHHSDGRGMVDLQTGKELVLLCRQNSLLPAVLELLQKGTGTNSNSGQAPPATTQSQSQSQSKKDVKKGQTGGPQIPTRAAHLQAAAPPKRSAGLRALMHDRRL